MMLTAIAVGGGYTKLVIMRALVITPAYIFGVWSGTRLFALAPKSWFKKVALIILMITGLTVSLA
jgi:hypothetical protein